MALLPRFISLGYQGKYLECVVSEGDSNGLLKLSGEDALSPKARIEVEKASCSDEMVHLKCCYKNKYLRRRSEKDDSIAAVATEPEEDQSKWSCTLFRPQPRSRPQPVEIESEWLPPDVCDDFDFVIMAPPPPPPPHHPEGGGGPYYLFSPVLLGKTGEEAQGVADTDDYYLKISSRTGTSEATAAFTVTDTQAVVRLPRFVIFKADNGKYLPHSPHPFLTFKEEDYMDAGVFEVFRMADASVRLRICFHPGDYFNVFLGFKDSNAVVDLSPDDLNNRFRPVKLGSNTNGIGLRQLSNNWLCKRHPTTDALVATSPQVEAAAVLEFEEAVGTRSVYDMNYRMEDAKLYDFAPVTSVTKDVKNETQTTQAGELTFSYTETKTESWGNMDSWGAGVTVSIKTRVPFVRTEASVGAEFEGEYQWGETIETENEIETQLQLEVPPMSRTKVTMIVSRGTLVVPFSYTQRDTLFNGQLIVTQVDGGVFSGVNTYVSYETTHESL